VAYAVAAAPGSQIRNIKSTVATTISDVIARNKSISVIDAAS
jgi:hypothetical protein